jgi:hypothetical protein
MTYNQVAIESGLDFILEHFTDNIFPRTISTKYTEGKQILVGNKAEALARFSQSNFLDCRISAYPPNALENPSATQRFVGLKEKTPSNIIVMIDLDLCNFKTDRALDMALTRTLNIIKDKLDAKPTVMWSGRGYHIIQPINSNGVVLENVDKFADTPNLSLNFLRFAESFLSSKKSDPQHNSTVSFNNCMLRIPGSVNSKNGKYVRVVREWDKRRPEINRMLLNFRLYMINQKYLEILNMRKREKDMKYVNEINRYDTSEIVWIERLLKTPLADHRKYCIWRIMTPYLLNIRKLSKEEVINILTNWLNQCNQLRRSDFNYRQKIREGLEGASEGYLPIAGENLKEENPELYSLLSTNE